MKLDKILINQLINVKNKNCKICKFNIKNRYKFLKIKYLPIKTTCVDKISQSIFGSNEIDLFPYYLIYKNKENIINLSNYLSRKINLQICNFRGVKKLTFIEFIAKEAVCTCAKLNDANIIKYINTNYNLNNLFKKELQILPYLMLNSLLQLLVSMCNNLQQIYIDICDGASKRNFIFYNFYSNAKIYGIAKYSPNLLKYIEISNVDIKKCIFNFINKLNIYKQTVTLIFKMLNKILKYTTYNGEEFILI